MLERERAAVEPETHSHGAAVSESQSTEHTPNTLMEMLCLLCRKGPARSPIQGIGEKHQNMGVCVCVRVCGVFMCVQLWIIKCLL